MPLHFCIENKDRSGQSLSTAALIHWRRWMVRTEIQCPSFPLKTLPTLDSPASPPQGVILKLKKLMLLPLFPKQAFKQLGSAFFAGRDVMS